MKSINYAIVELDEAYNNSVKLTTGEDFIINSTIEDVSYINRIAKVIAIPEGVAVKEGDLVIAHHNIFRLRNDFKGNPIESNYFIEGNKYLVPLTEIFMYKRNDSDWIPLNPFCFVKPIDFKNQEKFELSLLEASYKGKIKNMGVMVYPNPELLSQGVKKGDIVMFNQYSEYEFMIDGELYYKMSTRDVISVL